MNKIADLKEKAKIGWASFISFEALTSTAAPKLIEFAKENQTEFYKIWVKMLPQEVRASVAFSPELVAQIQEGRKRVSNK